MDNNELLKNLEDAVKNHTYVRKKIEDVTPHEVYELYAISFPNTTQESIAEPVTRVVSSNFIMTPITGEKFVKYDIGNSVCVLTGMTTAVIHRCFLEDAPLGELSSLQVKKLALVNEAKSMGLQYTSVFEEFQKNNEPYRHVISLKFGDEVLAFYKVRQ